MYLELKAQKIPRGICSVSSEHFYMRSNPPRTTVATQSFSLCYVLSPTPPEIVENTCMPLDDHDTFKLLLGKSRIPSFPRRLPSASIYDSMVPRSSESIAISGRITTLFGRNVHSSFYTTLTPTHRSQRAETLQYYPYRNFQERIEISVQLA